MVSIIIKMNEQQIKQATEDMEKMLDGLERFVSENGGVNTLLPKDHPKLIGKGETALVFGLLGGIVGKVIDYSENEGIPNTYTLVGSYVGGSPRAVELTVKALREMGFRNVLDHVDVRYTNKAGEVNGVIMPYWFNLSPDLRESGKYDVYSIEAFPFDSVNNGQELIIQLDTSLSRIKSEIKSEKYVLQVDYHGTRDKPDEALRKMFIGRVDKQIKQGELFFADLNHCVINRNT